MSSRLSRSSRSSRSSKASISSEVSKQDKSKLDNLLSNPNTVEKNNIILTVLLSILYYLLIISYLITLEDQQCDCIRDWRHDFIKYYSVFMIFYILIMLLLSNINNILSIILRITLFLVSLVNVWCLYTYIGDLDKTYCACAIEKQKKMHYFLYNWRYILIGIAVLFIFTIIFDNLNL